MKQGYTVEFKVQAVKHARSSGIAQAARELGIVEQTLQASLEQVKRQLNHPRQSQGLIG